MDIDESKGVPFSAEAMAAIAANQERAREAAAHAAARHPGPAERMMAPWELHEGKAEQASIWHSGDLFDIDPLMVVDQMEAAARRRRRQMGYSL